MLVFFSVLIVFTGCKKDNENEDPNQEAPDFKTQQIDLPDAMTNANDPGAQQATAYVNMANSYAAMGAMMVPPGKSTLVKDLKDGTPWTYTWEVDDGTGQFTVTLTVTEDAVKYMWEFVINGNLDGIQVTNFVYLRGIEYKDGSFSSLEGWDPQTGELAFSWTWSNNSGTITMELLFPGETKIVVVINPDNSGSMEFYEWMNNQWILEFRVVWTAAGTGEWWEYDNGVLVDTGSWP